MNYFKSCPSNNHFFPEMFFHEIQLFFNHYLHSYLIFLLPTGPVSDYFTIIFFKKQVLNTCKITNSACPWKCLLCLLF